jgi:hypothetical protein
LAKLSRKSDTTNAVRYALTLWEALVRYCDQGRLELDNNAAERALRAVALGRKNYLFAGSDAGGFDKYSGEISGRISCHTNHRPSILHKGISSRPADAP